MSQTVPPHIAIKSQAAPQWSSVRRRQLEKLIHEKLPCSRYNQSFQEIPQRDFEKEAKAKLPKLFREIDRHNKIAIRTNDKRHEAARKLNQDALNTARYGTDAEVSKLATRLLKK